VISRILFVAVILLVAIVAAIVILAGAESRKRLSDVAVAPAPVEGGSESLKPSASDADGATPIEPAGIKAPLETVPCEYGLVLSFSPSRLEQREQTSASQIEPPADIKATVERARGVLQYPVYGPGYMGDGARQMASPLGIRITNDNDWTWPIARILVNDSYELTLKNMPPGSGVIVACRGWESGVIAIRITVMTADSALLGIFETILAPPHAIPEVGD
jgi:hypothetical protein